MAGSVIMAVMEAGDTVVMVTVTVTVMDVTVTVMDAATPVTLCGICLSRQPRGIFLITMPFRLKCRMWQTGLNMYHKIITLY